MTFVLGLDLTFSTILLDSVDCWNLADVQRANGSMSSRLGPNQFLRNAQLIELPEELNRSSNLRIDLVASNRQIGTWLEERLAYAYAEWVSAQFHRAVLETFQAATRGDGEAAVEVANNILFHIRSDSL
ncbi:KilA-N domain-containing protein [Citrobacter portucalensis]|uniref:KilA-N domain-containing protein n=1 Tax=Citrobacter portucalensis TaxID=1639133 RepID=UPI002B23D6B5|nr:KilA-N domain-containing protein [Citrobacter portucalensis]MEB0775598.1 KilA-N domain-containing protein [Citrobacter portucalensis]MEB0842455.1 KilA-N domain-containing protein [Citrobacter portucalensis]